MAPTDADATVLRAIINHVFLPPKLPDRVDDFLKWEEKLLELLRTSLASFENLIGGDDVSKIQLAQKSLLKFMDARQPNGYIDEDFLRMHFSSLGKSYIALIDCGIGVTDLL